MNFNKAKGIITAPIPVQLVNRNVNMKSSIKPNKINLFSNINHKIESVQKIYSSNTIPPLWHFLFKKSFLCYFLLSDSNLALFKTDLIIFLQKISFALPFLHVCVSAFQHNATHITPALFWLTPTTTTSPPPPLASPKKPELDKISPISKNLHCSPDNTKNNNKTQHTLNNK